MAFRAGLDKEQVRILANNWGNLTSRRFSTPSLARQVTQTARPQKNQIDRCITNGTIIKMFDIPYILKVAFYRSETGNEPVREWLKGLPREDKRKIGEDIKTTQIGWPLGMPLVRKIDKDLWEVRTRLANGIARIFFTVDFEYMVLLHGFIKKSQKTPQNELKTALTRLGNYKRG